MRLNGLMTKNQEAKNPESKSRVKRILTRMILDKIWRLSLWYNAMMSIVSILNPAQQGGGEVYRRAFY